MKLYLKILYSLIAIIFLYSCNNDRILFDSSKNYIAFVSSSTSINESSGQQIGIPVMVAAVKGSPSITVDFEVVSDSSTAVEGANFTIDNSSKTLTVSEGYGYDTIWVSPIDNDAFTGNLSIVLALTTNSLDYQFGASDTAIVTLVDDEHPLGKWIGTYNVDAVSYYGPGTYDESWTVTTYADNDNYDILWFSGIAGGDVDTYASFDTIAGTITFSGGSDIGDPYGYGSTSIYFGTEDMIANAGDYITEDIINASLAYNIEGNISDDGTMTIDSLAIVLEDYVYCYDVFNTTWQKASE